MLGGMHSGMKTCFIIMLFCLLWKGLLMVPTWITLHEFLVHFLQFNGGISTNNIVNKLVSFDTNGV